MQILAGRRERRMFCWMALAGVMVFSGCIMVGPDFTRPEPQAMQQWMEADDAQVRTSPADYRMWWTPFKDPVLDHLVQVAYAQNITLRVAGARVFEARTRLGIAIGEQYPQVQQAVGSALDIRESERSPTAPQRRSAADQFEYKQVQVAAAASWEIDFWGKFRQAKNALCILLGMPPGKLDHLLGERSAPSGAAGNCGMGNRFCRPRSPPPWAGARIGAGCSSRRPFSRWHPLPCSGCR